MDFAVLGPVEVRDEGRSIPLSRGRPRRLLIALLLRVGRVVSADVLIDQIWGEHAPADAANALQVQVSYLRRALKLSATGAAPALRTLAGGYVLDVAPESVDAHRFERLVASAAERMADASSEETETALAKLREALGLWRGEPLQDVAYEPFAEAEVARLSELRAVALEHEIDARLILGRHEEAVPALRQLIAEHPLREHLRAQLVVALYRSGRQAEALRAFSAARQLLVSELGVEPGRELQDVHEAVLAHDPKLDWTRPAPRAHAGGPDEVPHNLPWTPTPLIGRGPETMTVGNVLENHQARLITLVGPPGVGKTRLAVELARHALRAFPDGVWFVDLSGVADPALVPTTMAAAARVRIDGAGSVTDALAAHWRDARVLVVLDNCEHLVGTRAAEGVHCVLASCPGVSILATSRVPLQVRGEHEVPIQPLALPAAYDLASIAELAEIPSVALFVARVREVNHGFRLTAANASAVAAICARLDGLPLALELAARWMRLLTAEELLARLDSSLDVLRDGPVDLPDRQRSVRDAVRWSYDLLEPADQAMLRRLAVFVGGATLDAISTVSNAAGSVGDDAVALANRLVAASLMYRDDGERPRLRMLTVVREFALESLARSAEAEPTMRAHAVYYATMARDADQALRGPEQLGWLTRLADDRDNLRAALAWSSLHDVDQGLGMAAALWLFWEMRGEREEARSWLEGMVSAGDPSAGTSSRAWALRCLGNLDWTASRHEDAKARYEESLRVAREAGDEAAAASAIGNLGGLAFTLGDWTRSRELGDEAVRIHRFLGDDWMMAHALTSLAAATLILGDAAAAVARYREAVGVYARLGDERSEVWSLAGLAEAHHQAGDRDQAPRLLTQALTRAVAFGEHRTVAYALQLCGLLALDEGDAARGEQYLVAAVQTRREHLGREDLAADLALLAEVTNMTRDRRRAARILGAAAAIARDVGDALEPRIEARLARTRAELRLALGEDAFGAAWEVGHSSPDDVVDDVAATFTPGLDALIDDVAADPLLRRAG